MTTQDDLFGGTLPVPCRRQALPMSFDVEPAIWWEVDQQLDDGKVQTWLQRAETADKAIERIADEIHRRGDKVAVILAVRRDR